MYPKCYLSEGCGGDEFCQALCPDVRRSRRHQIVDDICGPDHTDGSEK